MSEQNDQIKVKIYSDFGVKISFHLFSLPEWKFKALTDCIQLNRDNGKIEIADLFHDHDDYTHISIKGISQNEIPEFVKMLECELMQSIQPQFIHKKMIDNGMIT